MIQIQGQYGTVTGQANNASTTIFISAGYGIFALSMVERSGASVTGGVNIGTTSGGSDVVSAFAVAAKSMSVLPDALVLKKAFFGPATTPLPQTLYISAGSSWNGATVDIRFHLVRMVDYVPVF